MPALSDDNRTLKNHTEVLEKPCKYTCERLPPICREMS